MRVLRRHRPTPEQVALINRIRAGVTVIRGAAGSGKTSTALFSLRASVAATINQLRAVDGLPARVLVLTYYNSLAGYIETVARDELSDFGAELDLEVSTFDRWALHNADVNYFDNDRATGALFRLAAGFPRKISFAIDEASYVLGRFLPDRLDDYVGSARVGRGNSPTMDRTARAAFLRDVIKPFVEEKVLGDYSDFSDLAVKMIGAELKPYDVIVVDESQDLSANQIRAVAANLADGGILTFVTDTAQRIYPRGTTWAECGIAHPRMLSLSRNYRNTKAIARLAAAIAEGLSQDTDGTLPDPDQCSVEGELPILLHGLYSAQIGFALERLQGIDLENDTVGFLHLKGGGWFAELRKCLARAGFQYVELQGARDWPEHGGNIGLSTLHSAKGLEFDYVFILGLAQEQVDHGDDDEDDRLEALRRLLAMAVGRARKEVIIGAKSGEGLKILDTIARSLVTEIMV